VTEARPWGSSVWRRATQIVFLLAGLSFIALSLRGIWRDDSGVNWPSLSALGVAAALLLLAQSALLPAWASLLGVRTTSPGVARGLYLSHFGRYIPGAVWQPIGQVTLARGSRSSFRTGVVAYVAYLVVAVCASLGVGATYAVLGSLTLPWRLLPLLGLASILFLNRKVQFRIWRAAKTIGILRLHGESLPPQRAIRRSYFWMLACFATQGVAFAIVYSSMVQGDSFVGAVSSFPISWAIGFLAFLVPSGMGVREALLALLLPAGGSAGVVAASLVYRVVGIAADILMVVISGSAFPSDTR